VTGAAQAPAIATAGKACHDADDVTNNNPATGAQPASGIAADVSLRGTDSTIRAMARRERRSLAVMTV
jgi:hypothetical protein